MLLGIQHHSGTNPRQQSWLEATLQNHKRFPLFPILHFSLHLTPWPIICAALDAAKLRLVGNLGCSPGEGSPGPVHPRRFCSPLHTLPLSQQKSLFIVLSLFATMNFKNAKCSEGGLSLDLMLRLTCGVQFNKAVLCMPYPKSKGQGGWWP